MINLKLIPALFALFLLIGCGGKTSAVLEETHADGKVKITVKGERALPLDPWKVDLAVKAYNHKEGKLTFEITADDLNSESVNFKWLEDTNCHIVFTQRDNTVRTFQLLVSAEQLQLAEI